jgi:hypothetical protein
MPYISVSRIPIGGRRGGGAAVLPQLATPVITTQVFTPERIDLTWATVSDVASWKLEWSPNGTDNWTQIGGTITAVTLTYSHTGLTTNTKYYYRLTAVGDGVNQSDSEFGLTYDTTAVYLTSTTVGSNAEFYNSNKGFRRKAGSSGWGNYLTNGALFTQNFENGDIVVLKVATADLAATLMIANSYDVPTGGIPLASNYASVDYGIYSGFGLTPKAVFLQDAAQVAGEQNISAGDLFRFRYIGGYIYLDYSSNSGATWTNFKTSTVAPSGKYYILYDGYSASGGFDEIYKISPKAEGALRTNEVWLFSFFGESNSGGYAVNTDLSAGQLASRAAVKIWHNTASEFQSLDIGTNNLISHDGMTDNASHGWENGLANKVEDLTLPTPVYLAKCGQGGSLISHWELTDAFYTTMIARIKATINAVDALGKVPRLVLWYSFGVNDIINTTDEATWKAAVQALFTNIRTQFRSTNLIIMPYLMTSADAYNDSIQSIADTDDYTITFDTTNLTTYPKRDTYHWNKVGMENMAHKLVADTLSFYA